MKITKEMKKILCKVLHSLRHLLTLLKKSTKNKLIKRMKFLTYQIFNIEYRILKENKKYNTQEIPLILLKF